MIDPALWTANAVLGDGETVSIRPITPGDAPRLADFHLRQSADSIYRRYFSPKPALSARELAHFTDVDLVDRAALVVESHGRLLGWASYERWPGRDDADTAFMVDDEHHGKGVATLLLEHLAAIATSNGIERFTAEVLGDNRPMLTVFSRAGWPVQRRFDHGIIEVDFPIAATPEFVDSVSRREQRADSRAMARMLLPRAIAVVGATDRPGSVGATVWHNVIASATVPVYAVNDRHGGRLGEHDIHPTVSAVPDDVSLAVVVVPAKALAATFVDCIEAGVRGLVVMTSVDGTGVDIGPMVAAARSNGMRVIGPSSLGVSSSSERIGLDASLLPARPSPGGVAMSMQSASLGGSFLELARQRHVGLSWFVSLGDRADVSGNDLLQFWEDDETTKVIGLYTENLGNPRRFARIARRVSLRRPIVAVRHGTDLSPTGSALYRHCGLIEVPTVTALLDTVRVLATQPVLAGNRVAVLSNYPSPRTLAHAALEAAGLRPVDPPARLDFRASPADYRRGIEATLASDDVDGLVVIFAPPLAERVGDPVEAIDAAAAGSPKPVAAVLLATPDGPIRPGSVVPNFMFPEPAAASFGRSWAYGNWLATEAAEVPVEVADVDVDRARELIVGTLTDGFRQLDPATTEQLLTSYGIAVPATRFVAAIDAVGAAIDVGFPVAIKARRRHVGRSVRAGVALDIVDENAVAASIEVMSDALGDDADYVIVQSMAAPGVDLRIHVEVDDEAGPLVAVGIGGIQADVTGGDDPVRLAPLSLRGARELVGSSHAGQALAHASVDLGGFVDTLTRAAQLAAAHPEITALDLNPVITTAAGCCVTDAVVTVTPIVRPIAALRTL